MENVYLVVGLGNPGRDYARTRHNAGYLVVQRLAERWGAGWSRDKNLQGQLARLDRTPGRFLLCLPETYMNASGETVAAVTRYYQVPHERVLVVTDDADLALGTLRLRPGGSSGGHHGLESIARHLGTEAFSRLRVGIGRQAEGGRQIKDYVLSPFDSEETELLGMVLKVACDQIECWSDEGISQAMNRFNGAVKK